ncbi:11590_t:CDS:1, partial [Diversispora eburnea]
IALGKLRDIMNWDEYIPAVLFAYRIHKHNTTRFTPFFLLYG